MLDQIKSTLWRLPAGVPSRQQIRAHFTMLQRRGMGIHWVAFQKVNEEITAPKLYNWRDSELKD